MDIIEGEGGTSHDSCRRAQIGSVPACSFSLMRGWQGDYRIGGAMEGRVPAMRLGYLSVAKLYRHG